jgi:PAS domain S-box-containing protein
MSNADTKADVAQRKDGDVSPLSITGQIAHLIKWKSAKRQTTLLHEAGCLLLGLALLAALTSLCFWLDAPLVSTAFSYLVIILLLSLVSNVPSTIALSFIGVCCLSYFFAPPIYSFRVEHLQDLNTISAFVITSFIVTFLVTRVRVEQRRHMMTCETLRDANQRLELVNKALLIENLERERAEQALQVGEYKLRQIIDTVPGLIWSMGPDGEPTHVGQRLLDYSGMRFEDFRQAGWKAFVHPDDFPEAERAYHQAIQSETSYRGLIRLRRADGEFRWHLARCEPLRDRHGRIIHWYGLSVDIEDGKKAEEWPRFVAQLQAILNVLPAYTWYAAPSGGLTFVNKRTADYLGVPNDHPLRFGIDIGAQWDDWVSLLHPDDREGSRKYWSSCLRSGEAGEHSYRVRSAQGAYRWFLTRFEPLRASDGTPLLWIGATLDVEELKRAEQSLRDSEAKIRRLVDANIIGIFIWDFDGRILEANKAFLDIVGYDHEDLLAGRLRWTDLTPPEWHDRDTRLIQEQKISGTLQPFEKEYFRRDGSRVPVMIGVATFEESGNQGVAFVLNLTESKRAEQALRESESRFRHYAETASDWFWEIGPDCKFTLLTDNAFGSGAADRIGATYWDHALDLETEPEKWRLFRATLYSRKPFRDFVYLGLSGDGSSMYVRASGKPVFDANGEFRGYRGTCTDVTEIMRAHEALRESEQRSRSAIDGIAGLVAIMAPNGEIETVNRQVFEYCDRSLEELKNWGTSDAVHREDLPRVVERFKRAIASGNSCHVEQRLRRFDGEYRWFDTRGVPVRDEAGRITRWYILLTDIEDRTRALSRLQQMQSDFAHMNRVSMMGELAASLSHEISQPIASARNNARAALNFLDRHPTVLGDVKEALACVVDDADRAGEIIDRIRDQIRKAPPRTGSFDLNEAVNEVIALGRSAIIKNRVLVRTQLAQGSFLAQGDRVQLQQVILNLVLNAVEAMGPVEAGPRELLISTERTEVNGALVAVRDSGPGVDLGYIERVFEPFYTTKSSGVGMGLPICRSIIDAHGGRLWADANEPRGAVFQFTLPGVEGAVRSKSQKYEGLEKGELSENRGTGGAIHKVQGPWLKEGRQRSKRAAG